MLDLPPEFDYHYAEARQFNLHLTNDIDFTQFLPFAKLDAWMMSCFVKTTTQRTVTSTGETSEETRYFITSLAFDAQYIA